MLASIAGLTLEYEFTIGVKPVINLNKAGSGNGLWRYVYPVDIARVLIDYDGLRCAARINHPGYYALIHTIHPLLAVKPREEPTWWAPWASNE